MSNEPTIKKARDTTLPYKWKSLECVDANRKVLGARHENCSWPNVECHCLCHFLDKVVSCEPRVEVAEVQLPGRFAEFIDVLVEVSDG